MITKLQQIIDIILYLECFQSYLYVLLSLHRFNAICVEKVQNPWKKYFYTHALLIEGIVTQNNHFINVCIYKNYKLFRYECNKGFLVRLALYEVKNDLFVFSRRPN